MAVILFADRTADFKKALLYSKELLNIAPRCLEKRNIDASQMYFTHAFVYFKLACSSRFESSRVAMKSSAFDNLKIASEVRLSYQLDSDNYWVKLVRGLLLLDVNFKEREGLKLLQEVNAAVPNKAFPMFCLALGFVYCQEVSKALLVMKECVQRFSNHSHLCYIFLAYLRVQEILQNSAEEKPLVPVFKQEDLELKDPDENDMEIAPLFSEAHIWEVELLFKKAIDKLLSSYNLKLNVLDVSNDQ